METLQKTLSAEEREALIAKLWVDKKGKKDISPLYAMYVALDNPRPNLAALTADMLEVLFKDSIAAEQWARTWGKVSICVAPGGVSGCFLNYTKEDANKRFIPVSSQERLCIDDMRRLISVMPEGKLGEITINSSPTTIEAFLISYVHMVDEFIWELYRKGSHGYKYKSVVDLVASRGFSVSLGTEESILRDKVNWDHASVRLYGSGVNKEVSKVMGGIVFRGGMT